MLGSMFPPFAPRNPLTSERGSLGMRFTRTVANHRGEKTLNNIKKLSRENCFTESQSQSESRDFSADLLVIQRITLKKKELK